MNKSLHRIVFNEARGQMMAVAENAPGHGGASGTGTDSQASEIGRAVMATIKPLAFALWIALGMVSALPSAQAQVVADRSAPARQQPTILNAPSGAPLVNIQTPSAAGVSRNTYTQFDVNAKGVVLNNSRTGTTSQVGGAVGPNPWLARGTARVILNEVNSTDPSRLRGVVEVAGDKAQVVIANPSGITCDGCGFINASRATMTTGTPIVNGGHLDGYRVERGTVSIDGRGMDARGADYTDVIARAVKVNAEVVGRDIKVRQGAAVVSADNAQASSLAGTGDKPAIGIDVSQLGGMYARKIVLIGGEAGVGVRNAGQIGASAGEVIVTADGIVTNTGRITATADVTVDATGGIDNRGGTVYAGLDARLATRGHLANTGTGVIAAGRHVQLEATGAGSTVRVEADATVAAGLQTTGEGDQARTEVLGDVANLRVQATEGVQLHGTLAAAAEIRVSSKLLDLGQSRLSGQNLLLVAMEGAFDARSALLLAGQSLEVRSAQALDTRGATLSAAKGSLTVRAASLDNTGGAIDAGAGAADIHVTGFLANGEGGHIGAGGTLSLTSTGLANAGTLRGGGDVTIDTRGRTLDNRGGRIVSGGTVSIRSARFDNEGGLVVGERLALDTQGDVLSNRQSDGTHGLVGHTGIVLTTASFDNHGGYVYVGDEGLQVNGSRVDNTGQGRIEGTGGIRLSGGELFDNRGGEVSVAGGVDLQVGAGLIDNRGGLIGSGGAVDLRADSVLNSDTQVQARIAAAEADAAHATQEAARMGIQGKSVQITALSVTNDNGVVLGNESVTVDSSGRLDNTGGTISAGRNLRIVDTSSALASRLNVINTGGTLIANEALQLSAARLSPDGTLHANGDLDLRLGSSWAHTGVLTAGHDLSITTAGSFTNSGRLSAGNALTLGATSINNTRSGEITAASTTLEATGQITNRGLINGDDTVLKAETLVNIGSGRIYGTHLGLQAVNLYNTDEPARPGLTNAFFSPWNASWYQASLEGETAAPERGKSGGIAARERLDVGVQNVRNANGAELSSGGDIHFGAALDANHQATGRAASVTNSSALIDAGGHIQWNVDQVLNTRSRIVYKTDTVSTREQTVLFDTGGAGHYRTVRELQTDVNTTTLDNTASSAAGVIRSDGAMDFGDARIRNEASGIHAFGGLTYDESRYSALATRTVETVKTGTDFAFIRDKCSKHSIACGSFKNNRMEAHEVAIDNARSSVTDAPDTEIRGRSILSGDPALYTGPTAQGAAAPVTPPVDPQAVPGVPANSAPGATNGASPDKTVDVRTGQVDLKVPTSSLFTSTTDPQARTLVTTDHQFAGYRQWLDSDYLLRELGVDPGSVGRRLGDGYYEQRLIRDQTARLLGSRLLDKHENNESEYIQLMGNAVDYAKKAGLKVGTALTPEQVAELPNDIVWLEYRDVGLADGSRLQALVPQVYARTKVQQEAVPGQLGKGIIAANRIDYTVAGDYAVDHALAARDALTIRADGIHNAGALLQAGRVALNARTDIQGTGGQLVGTEGVWLTAGRDIDLTTTLRTDRQVGTTAVQTRTQVDQLSSVSVTGAGGSLVLDAGRNLTLTGAQVVHTGSDGQTLLSAKGDLRLDSVELTHDLQYAPDAGNFGRHRRTEDVGTLVVGSGDVLVRAEGDLTARAAVVSSDQGVARLQAGQDLHLLDGRKTQLDDEARTHHRVSLLNQVTTVTRDTVAQSTSVGTTVAGAEVQLQAGRDVNLQATQVTARGLFDIDAGRDLNVTAGQDTRTESHDRNQFRRANTFGEQLGHTLNTVGLLDVGYAVLQKKAEDRSADQTRILAVGSVLDAGTLQTRSGRDTTLQAATVVTENDILLRAGRNLGLLAVEQQKQDGTHSGSHVIGQVGSWYQPAMGSVTQSQDASGQSTTLAGTQVMSLHGNLQLEVGEQYTQTASQLLAPEGSVQGLARKVLVQEGYETGQSREEGEYAKTALGGTISIPLVTAVQSIRSMVKAGEDTKNVRMRAMAAVNLAMAAKDAAGAVASMATNGMGGIKVSVNLSHDESRNSFEQSGRNAVESVIAAGGDVDIRARGAGDDSTLTVSGSRIEAGRDGRLEADGAVLLKASESTAHQQSKDSSAGVSIGVGFAMGGTQNGFTIDLAASMSRGRADGDDRQWGHTHLTAGRSFDIQSGGDMTLSGAVVQAPQLTGKVGGNLKVESLQDSSTYHSRQESAGLALSICIPPICAGISTIGGNYASSKIDSNFLAVAEQSGFKAGDGGYQFDVAGDTHLIGGVLASSDQAIANGKNSFTHGGRVTLEDIQNKVEFKGAAVSVAVTVGGQVGEPAQAGSLGSRVSEWAAKPNSWLGQSAPSSTSQNAATSSQTGVATPAQGGPANAASASQGNAVVVGQDAGRQPSTSLGYADDSGLRLSTTRAAIGASTSEDTAGIIAPIFDAAKVRRELGAQTRITQTFSQVVPRAIGDWAKSQQQPVDDARTYEELQQKQAEGRSLTAQEQDSARQLAARGMTAEKAQSLLNDPQALEAHDRWGEGQLYRVALHTVAGALVGRLDGALGAGTVAVAAPALEDLQQRVGTALVDVGLRERAAQFTAQGFAQLTAAGVGAAVGNTPGAGLGLAVDTNNRQLHPGEKAELKNVARRLAKEKLGEEGYANLSDPQRWSVENYWYEQLEQEAMALNDSQAQAARGSYLGKIGWTGSQPGLSGSYYAGTYLENAAIANRAVQDLAAENRPLLSMYGDQINAGGQPLFAFQSTQEQRQNSQLLRSAANTAEARLIDVHNQERLQVFATPSGAAEPMYVAENLALFFVGGRLPIPNAMSRFIPSNVSKTVEAIAEVDGAGVAAGRTAELQAKWGEVTAAERRALLEDKSEVVWAEWLSNRDATAKAVNPKTHFLEKHGPDTALISQEIRASTKLAPDGSIDAAFRDSTRFLSAQDMGLAFQRADSIFLLKGKVNGSYVFNMEKIIGEGYTKHPGLNWVRSTNVSAVYKNGQPYTVYPILRSIK